MRHTRLEVTFAPGTPQLVELFVSACGCELPVDASELIAHASAVRRGVLPLGFAAWGVKGNARGGARAASGNPLLAGLKAGFVVAVCGSLGRNT